MSKLDRANPQPGIYPGIPASVYFALDAVNASTLKLFRRTALHAHHEITTPRDETPAMRLGTAVHAAILEPERFGDDYTTAPKVDRRTKEGKAEWAAFLAENEGREILSHDEFLQCMQMQESAWGHPLMREILSGEGYNEVVIIWIDQRTGLKCKARIDRFTMLGKFPICFDLKTTKDADEWRFGRDAHTFGYHASAAFYMKGLAALDSTVERRHIIGACESFAPYACRVFELRPTSLEQGANDIERYLDMYAECKASGNWPGYPAIVEPLDLPRYAIKTEDWEVRV